MDRPGDRAPHLRFRADIEGLRAVAVGLVVLFHAGVPHVAGGYVGVDVFFVISGYLITGLLVSELGRDGTLSFAGFYARRARRILPMATIVLVAIAVAFDFVLVPLDHGPLRSDIINAALYFANWHFAVQSLHYGTNASANPVLHYWSLSVEEQFYILWPLLLFLLTRRRAAAGRGFRARRVVIGLALVGVASLAASIVLTAHSPTYSYYGLHTRAWELAAGGLLAIATPRLTAVPGMLRVVLGWAGLAMIVASAVWFGASTVFPGVAAVLPVAGAVLVIAAGSGAHTQKRGVGDILRLLPVTYCGRISYSLYLWHWPCLVLIGTALAPKGSSFRVAHGWWAVLAVAISVALSALSNRLVENPLRTASWLRRSHRALAGGGLGVATAVVVAFAVLAPSDGAIHGQVLTYVSSLSSDPAPVTPVEVTLRMSPGGARRDAPRGTRDCFSAYQTTAAAPDCEFGDSNGTKTVALVGDSHALALFPALDRLAIDEHWRLWFWAKPACPLIDLTVRVPQFDDSYPWCTGWQHSVVARLDSLPHLDTVFVTNYGDAATIPDRYAIGNGPSLNAEQLPAAWRNAWRTTDRQLAAASRNVVMIRDVPDPVSDVPDCLESHAPDEVPCAIPRHRAFADADVLYHAERPVSGSSTYFIDIDSALCPGTGPCPVVTSGGDIIYRDDEHLTATVSSLLVPALRHSILALAPFRPSNG